MSHLFVARADLKVPTVPFRTTGEALAALLAGQVQAVVETVPGVVGQIQPAIPDARGFPAAEPIYAAELDLDALAALGASDIQRAEPLPRFPAIVRDLSILVDDGLPAAAVRGTIRRAAPPTLVQLAEFDRYRGKGIPEGRVSLSLRLTFRSSERTLTDAEVDEAMTRVVAALEASHGAQRR